MSQGIPVIGSAYGSLQELISPESGIICQSYREFLKVITEPKSFDPRAIRKYVEDHFSVSDYSKKYLELYKRVIAGEKLNEKAPKLIYKQRAEELLHF